VFNDLLRASRKTKRTAGLQKAKPQPIAAKKQSNV